MVKMFKGSTTQQFTQWIQSFVNDPRARLYGNLQNPNQLILILPSEIGAMYLHDTVFMSEDIAKTFTQLKTFGCHTEGRDFRITYEDPRTNITHSLALDGDILTRYLGPVESNPHRLNHGVEHYTRCSFETLGEKCIFIPIPSVQEPFYLIQLSDGRYAFVTASSYPDLLDALKLYLGTPETMTEIEVKGADRFLDGGSTVVFTDVGCLFLGHGRSPFWTSVVLNRGDSLDFFGKNYPDRVVGTKLTLGSSETLQLIQSFNLIELPR